MLVADSLDKSQVKYPKVMAVPWRGENRDSFWRPRACDFYEDQPTYRALYLLSKLTGAEKYATFADASLRTAMSMSGRKGMFWWGSHRYWDVFTDQKMAPNGDHHETETKLPVWDELWRIDHRATMRELNGYWTGHVGNKTTGEHNRHNTGRTHFAFANAGGVTIGSLAYLYAKTGEAVWRQRAELVADYHWRFRNQKTGLTPSTPNLIHRPDSWMAHTQDQMVTGILCYYLLKSYEQTGVEKFRDHALAYLRSYAKCAYDSKTGKFFGSVWVKDGTVPMQTRVQPHYDCNFPSGYTDLWEPMPLSWEYPIYTAQVYAYAYSLTRDRDMLDAARKWANFIRNNPPETGCRTDTWWELYARLFSKYGTFAGAYGRTSSFYVNMYANTGEKVYLEDARRFAREAVSKLYYKGLFRGHPAQPYYSAIDGVGYLMVALLQLDRVMELGDQVVGQKTVPLKNGKVLGFDNW